MTPELLYRLNLGEQKAFKEVFHIYYKQLCNYLSSRGSQNEDDQDIMVADVFVNLYNSIQKGHPVESELHLRNILFGSVKKNLITFAKTKAGPKKRMLIHVDDIEEYDMEDVPESTDEAFRKALNRVKRAIGKLPPQCKVIFKMWAFDEMGYEEIGKALNLSPQTVRNQKTRALILIKQRLKIK